MVGILLSYRDGLFSGAMLVSGRVCINILIYIYIYIDNIIPNGGLMVIYPR